METEQLDTEQPWVNEEIKGEIKNYQKTHENSIYQNLRDTAKAVLRGKFIAIYIYLKKQEHSKTKNLTLYLR